MISRKKGFEWMVGLILVDYGCITRDQLDQAWENRIDNHISLLDALVSLEMISQETLATVLSFQLDIPVIDLRHVQVNPQAIQLIPKEYARKHRVLRIGNDTDGSIRIATEMPDFTVLAEISSGVIGCQVKFVLVVGGRLGEWIDLAYAPVGSVS